ncbi:MAG: CRISPR-associated protein Cas4 [Pseudohongiella sp.]|uniref:CRISPR-associated protein Cas4 n=1 Tax=Pseudohongiella sp. TaxID=1979412 RepID=UPI0034A059A0
MTELSGPNPSNSTGLPTVEDYLAISALQHYAYCPRQFALIHIEQAWAENRFTAEGQVLHQRVDSHETEQRGKVRYERSVSLMSHELGLIGKMDLIEIETGSPTRYFPVEYKRGKPKIEEWDKIQLCAQAFCIEEMRETTVPDGAIWYWEVRRRESVVINEQLRNLTRDVIEDARYLLKNGLTPAPLATKSRCRACSLKDICQPDTFRSDKTTQYVAEIGE